MKKTEQKNTDYYLGFDLGSEGVHAALIDTSGKIIFIPESLMHFGNPLETLNELYDEIIAEYPKEKIRGCAFTGLNGKGPAESSGAPFYDDTIAISRGADLISPGADYIIHLGAKDPYFFERERTGQRMGPTSFISDHGTGTKCGGGSGILINKQIRRFFAEDCPVKLKTANDKDHSPDPVVFRTNRSKLQKQSEQMHQRAMETILTSDRRLNVGGRCGVIIQSDMIHMQNSGEQIKNILEGMYRRIASNYKSDVIRVRTLDPQKKAVATGGIFLNRHLISIFSEELALKIEAIEHGEKIGAVGAALKAMDEGISSSFDPSMIASAKDAEISRIKFAPALSSALHRVQDYGETTTLKETALGLRIFKKIKNKNYVIIGVDGGSTTTKALISDAENMDIIAEICIDTDGRPLEAAQRIFEEINKYFKRRLEVKSIVYTGSSANFYYKLFTDFSRKPDKDEVLTDFVKDEITCHASGVRHFNSKVDTIFECGGQDAKFTVFNTDGTVKKAKMNLSCMAGTGQSMKNMIDMLGMDFKNFGKYALSAERTPVTDEMCAIFTEAGVLKLLSLGFPKEELAAAIAYGFIGGYANKFVGNESFGSMASAQGGPFKGKECLAALALHTGSEIHAFPHRQLFGAMGAAVIGGRVSKDAEASGKKILCRFRGFNIAGNKFEKSIRNCSEIIEDTCGLRDCRLQVYSMGSETIFSGGLCPKGNTDSTGQKAPDYVELYKKYLQSEISKYSCVPEEIRNDDQIRLLIPRSLHFLNERGVFFTRLYHELGFKVVVSPESDDRIAELGIAHSHSESCYPSKIHYGHAAYLKKYLRSGIDKMLLVNFLGVGEKHSPQNQSKTCPYISGAGFAAKEAVKLDSKDALLPVILFNDKIYKLENDIWIDIKRAFDGTDMMQHYSRKQVKKAVKIALDAQKIFDENIQKKGEAILERLKARGEKIFVGIGRGYTLFDNKTSSRIHELFIANGLHFIPAFFLNMPDYDFREVVHHMYWTQGRRMTRYNIRVAMDPNLYGVRETNFNCGPDAMLSYHETRIFDVAEKPYLTLQTDGHNSNAQFGTRIMANYEVVKNHTPKEITIKNLKKALFNMTDLGNRILGIPVMGIDSTHMLAGVFRSLGYRAEVMPTRTQESEAYARKYLITNNCLPLHIVFGDSFAWLEQKKKEGYDPNTELALFIPMAGGPCRLGHYHIIIRYFLDECGYDQVGFVSPAAYLDWENLPFNAVKRSQFRKRLAHSSIASDLLLNAEMRIRPYEKIPGQTDKVFKELRKEFMDIVERGAKFKELSAFLKHAVEVCKTIDFDPKIEYPRVSLFGEIFVRSHEGANEDSIRKLEKHKLEIVPRLISEMLEYCNKMQKSAFWKEKNYKSWFKALIKGIYVHWVEKDFSKPFKDLLSRRIYKRPIAIYDELRKNNLFDIRIKGEAGISIGVSHEMMNENYERISGLYQLEPFGCMQECVAASKIQSLIDISRSNEKVLYKRVIPYLTGVFGDSELSNLDAEMAMFAEKCRIRMDLEKKAKNE